MICRKASVGIVNHNERIKNVTGSHLGRLRKDWSEVEKKSRIQSSQVDSWHRRLGKESRGGHLQWVKSKVPDFRYVEGKAESRNMKVWTIRELLNSEELAAEGRSQQHCVATYARSCLKGHTSIWTLDMQTNINREKLLTIELHLRDKTIRQVRGLRNRLATKAEIDVIRRWATKENLTIANYVTYRNQ